MVHFKLVLRRISTLAHFPKQTINIFTSVCLPLVWREILKTNTILSLVPLLTRPTYSTPHALSEAFRELFYGFCFLQHWCWLSVRVTNVISWNAFCILNREKDIGWRFLHVFHHIQQINCYNSKCIYNVFAYILIYQAWIFVFLSLLAIFHKTRILFLSSKFTFLLLCCSQSIIEHPTQKRTYQALYSHSHIVGVARVNHCCSR